MLSSLPHVASAIVADFLEHRDLLAAQSCGLWCPPRLADQKRWEAEGILTQVERGDLVAAQYLYAKGEVLPCCATFRPATTGDLTMLKWLYEVEKRLESIQSALCVADIDYAASKGHMEVFEWLYAQGIRPSASAVTMASMHGQLAMVKHLFAIGTPFTEAAMYYACDRGALDVARFLYSEAVPLSARALQAARRNGHWDLAKTLLAEVSG